MKEIINAGVKLLGYVAAGIVFALWIVASLWIADALGMQM